MRRFSILLFLILALLPVHPCHADKKDKKEAAQVYVLPEPDPLKAPSVPHISAAPIPPVQPHVIHHVSTSSIYGIDVSHYQGLINWQMVKTDKNASYVYIKATEGAGYVDQYYLRNLRGAKEAGIPVGVYHFFTPSASAMTQLKNFSDNVDLRHHDLAPIIDVEKRGKGSLQQFVGRLAMFLEQIEKAYGVQPIIYTGQNFYNEYLAGSFLKYRFMIAKYQEEPPMLVDNAKVVMWQFTSEGHVNGIRNNVDRSVFLDNYSLSDIKK